MHAVLDVLRTVGAGAFVGTHARLAQGGCVARNASRLGCVSLFVSRNVTGCGWELAALWTGRKDGLGQASGWGCGLACGR